MPVAAKNAVILVAFGGLLLVGEAGALQASPGTPPADLREVVCAATPRPRAELRQLTLRGLEAAAASVQGTPGPSTATPANGGGEPADQATEAAVVNTIYQVTACQNENDRSAQVALLTDEAAAKVLAAGAVGFARGSGATGDVDASMFDLDEATVDAYLDAIAAPSPAAAGDRSRVLDVRDVRLLGDDRATATAVIDFGGEGAEEYTILLRRVDGRWVVEF